MIPRLDSCFGYTLQTGTKLSATFQMILAMGLVGLSIIRITSEEGFDFYVSISIFIIIQLLLGIFSFLLFEGSKDRNLQSVKIWIKATTFLIIALTCNIVYMLYDDPSLRIYSAFSLFTILSIFANIGFIWVTESFGHLLEEQEGEGGTVYNS